MFQLKMVDIICIFLRNLLTIALGAIDNNSDTYNSVILGTIILKYMGSVIINVQYNYYCKNFLNIAYGPMFIKIIFFKYVEFSHLILKYPRNSNHFFILHK